MDAYQLAARHGLHYTEIERIASRAHGIRIINPRGKIAGTIEFLHRNGDRHVLSLTPESPQAVIRIQNAGTVPPESVVRNYLTGAAKNLGQAKPLHLACSGTRS